MKKQFNLVNCKYGAPMGRSCYGDVASVEGKISLFHVRITQGYDDGGAYWGNATSYKDQLYCARSIDNDSYRQFVRAGSRDEARVLLNIPQAQLAKRTKETA